MVIIVHKCPYCPALVRYFDEQCHSCRRPIVNSFWDSAYENALEMQGSHYLSSLSTEADFLSGVGVSSSHSDYDDRIELALEGIYGHQAELNICCGRHFKECLCPNSLDFESAIADDNFHVEKAYQDSECEKCALWFTPYCSPLISYITDVFDNIEPMPVIMCSDFITEQELEKIAQVDDDYYFGTSGG